VADYHPDVEPVRFADGGMPCQLVARNDEKEARSAFILRAKDVHVGTALNIGAYNWMVK